MEKTNFLYPNKAVCLTRYGGLGIVCFLLILDLFSVAHGCGRCCRRGTSAVGLAPILDNNQGVFSVVPPSTAASPVLSLWKIAPFPSATKSVKALAPAADISPLSSPSSAAIVVPSSLKLSAELSAEPENSQMPAASEMVPYRIMISSLSGEILPFSMIQGTVDH